MVRKTIKTRKKTGKKGKSAFPSLHDRVEKYAMKFGTASLYPMLIYNAYVLGWEPQWGRLGRLGTGGDWGLAEILSFKQPFVRRNFFSTRTMIQAELVLSSDQYKKIPTSAFFTRFGGNFVWGWYWAKYIIECSVWSYQWIMAHLQCRNIWSLSVNSQIFFHTNLSMVNWPPPCVQQYQLYSGFLKWRNLCNASKMFSIDF